MLKNKIIPIISLKLFNDVEFLLNNLFVNKSNVSGTLITIVGEITFKRTYHVSKHANKKFFT